MKGFITTLVKAELMRETINLNKFLYFKIAMIFSTKIF